MRKISNESLPKQALKYKALESIKVGQLRKMEPERPN